MIDKIKYSEIFGGNTSNRPTIQGEGMYTGIPSVWLRYFGCNFECKGFGQKCPSKPETYELDYQDFDFSKIKSMDQVPMIKKGCDSAYSWSEKFKHLAPTGTAAEIADEIEKKLTGGKFIHPKTKQDCHLIFTGGEPMLRGYQNASVGILREFYKRDNLPYHITIETNTTQMPTPEFAEHFTYLNQMSDAELLWSCSPKLYLSGESWDKAIRPEVMAEYVKISNFGQLKYVVDGSDRAWEEVERATDMYREVGCMFPVWIMPVGSDAEQQENNAAKIADAALERGYNVAARVQVYLYRNEMGR